LPPGQTPRYFAYIWCGGWDLNPRTPSGRDLESCAHPSVFGRSAHLFFWMFDLALRPPHTFLLCCFGFYYFFPIVCYEARLEIQSYGGYVWVVLVDLCSDLFPSYGGRYVFWFEPVYDYGLYVFFSEDSDGFWIYYLVYSSFVLSFSEEAA